MYHMSGTDGERTHQGGRGGIFIREEGIGGNPIEGENEDIIGGESTERGNMIPESGGS